MGLRDRPVYDRAFVADRIGDRATRPQFGDLPPDVKQEIRARWRDEVQRQIDREDARLETRIATVLTCILVFLFVTIVWDVPTVVTVPAAVIVGLLTGLVWNALDVGRFGALLSVLPGYVVLRALGPPQNAFVMFFGFVAMSSFATLCGALREIREGNVRPSGFARRVRRLWRSDQDASSLLAARGALDALPTGADPCIRPWGPAPEQGGDERRSASWTDWDLRAGDPEP